MLPTPRTLRLVLAVSCLLGASLARGNERNNYELAHWDDYVGSYQIEGDHQLIIGLNWGGGLTYLDTRDGLFGRLAQVSKDHYADEGRMRIVFLRDHDSLITGMKCRTDNGSEWRATALALSYVPLSIPSDSSTLAGTLILPANENPHPAIILNGGASWIVREQVLEDALMYASQGIAAFVYDKRGWGESSGEKSVPFATSARDILAIANYLRYNRMDLNPKRIGISTYSQSGWYGTLAASMSDAIGFLILNVPSATFVYRQEFQRVENELRADDFTSQQIHDALAFMGLMSRFSGTGEGWDQYAAAREQASQQSWFHYLFAPKTPDPGNWRWGRMNWEYNPLPALMKITAPTLVLLGEQDKKVLPEVNRSVFEMAFEAAGNHDAVIVIVPNMNHDLVVSHHGGRKEATPNQMVSDYLTLRLGWLRSHLSLPN